MLRVPTKSTCAGFTLVELLVALTIMALVLGLLMNSMRFSLSTVDAVESRIAAIESLHQSQRALRRQLQLATPVLSVDSENPEQLDFTAGLKQLDFIAPIPGLSKGAGLYRISLRIEDDPRPDGHGGRLMMSYRMYIDAFEQNAYERESREFVLLEDFSRARFSFFDTARLSGAQWSHEWPHVDRLPGLVRLHIDRGDGSDGNALDLIVAIKTTSPSGLGQS